MRLVCDAGDTAGRLPARCDGVSVHTGDFLMVRGDTGLLSGDTDLGDANGAAFCGGHGAFGASGDHGKSKNKSHYQNPPARMKAQVLDSGHRFGGVPMGAH